MAINHNDLRSALKIMNEAPASIQRAQNLYKERLEEIKTKEKSGNYAPKLIESYRKTARDDRDLVVGRLMDQMEKAINTIDQNNSFQGETFDFSDPKFQSAINFLNLMGKDMSPQDQLLLLENFRGNAGALNALGSAMKKQGLYFASQANEMVKSIPRSALIDAGYVIGKYKNNGEVDLSRMTWSKGEFKKQAERLGYDLDDAQDPYIRALTDARNNMPVSEDPLEQAKNNAKKIKLDMAIREVSSAKAKGDGSEIDVFAKAVRDIEKYMAEATANANS